MELFPDIAMLHLRHPGVSRPKCEVFAEAAAVCLWRHHTPPTEFEVRYGATIEDRQLDWTIPTVDQLRTYANEIDTTEEGAYGVSIAAVEKEFGLVVVSRADTLTGADWLVAPPGEVSLEHVIRLEVSGVNRGEVAAVSKRVRMKVVQVTKPSDDPWMVSVVGFRTRSVRFERSE